MVTIRVPATLKPNGELEYQLPAQLPEEDFELVLDVRHAENLDANDELTDEERRDMLNFEGRPLGEIPTGGWEGMGIEDSVEWVNEQRRKARERRKSWME